VGEKERGEKRVRERRGEERRERRKEKGEQCGRISRKGGGRREKGKEMETARQGTKQQEQ